MASRSKRILPLSDNHQSRMFKITDNSLKKKEKKTKLKQTREEEKQRDKKKC